MYPDPIINPIIAYSEAIFSDSPEIASLPTVTDLNTKIIAYSNILSNEYESFLDGDYRNFHQLRNLKV